MDPSALGPSLIIKLRYPDFFFSREGGITVSSFSVFFSAFGGDFLFDDSFVVALVGFLGVTFFVVSGVSGTTALATAAAAAAFASLLAGVDLASAFTGDCC